MPRKRVKIYKCSAKDAERTTCGASAVMGSAGGVPNRCFKHGHGDDAKQLMLPTCKHVDEDEEICNRMAQYGYPGAEPDRCACHYNEAESKERPAKRRKRQSYPDFSSEPPADAAFQIGDVVWAQPHLMTGCSHGLTYGRVTKYCTNGKFCIGSIKSITTRAGPKGTSGRTYYLPDLESSPSYLMQVDSQGRGVLNLWSYNWKKWVPGEEHYSYFDMGD